MTVQNPALVRILAPMILVLAPVSASAQSAEPAAIATNPAASGLTGLTDPKLIDLYNKSAAANPADHCTILPMLSEMARRNFTGGVEEVRTEYQVQCAVDRKDWPKAYQGIKKWEALGSDKPPAQEWIFRLALLAGEDDEALKRLEIMTKLDDPEQLTTLKDWALFSLARKFSGDGRDDRATRQFQMLFESPHFPLLSAAIRSESALRMLEGHVKKGDAGDVSKMLAHITSPLHYTTMLADRSYEPIWPQIERLAGPNMAGVLGRYLQQKKSGLEATPDDKEAMLHYDYALTFSGRFKDVIALADPIDHEDPGSWDEEDGWLLDLKAYALDALGDTEAADRIFDRFVQVPYQSTENVWLVNFVINRASRLVDQKRWQEGLAAAQFAAEIAQKSSSPYAKMLVWKSQTCALYGLGRSGEAEAILSRIVEHQDDAPVVAAETLLCAGERERAAALVIDGLQDDAKRGAMIEALQKHEFDLFYSYTALPTIHAELRHHPEVAPVFTKLARDIPEEYTPLLGARAQKLAAEREAN